MLTPSQQQTFATAVRSSTDPTIISALANRLDHVISGYYNAASGTDCWRADIDSSALFEATPITNFDGLSAGKRDAWKLMLDQAGRTALDFGRLKLRNAVLDIWALAQANAILAVCTRKATVGELLFGGVVKTSGSVTATDLEFEVTLTTDDVSTALNNF